MLVLVALGAVLILGMFQAVLVACETSLLMLTPGRAERLAESDDLAGQALLDLIDVRHRMRAFIIFFMGFVAACTALVSVWISYTPWATISTGWLGAVVLVLASVVLYFIFFQAMPRAFAVTNPEYILLRTARFTLAFTRAFGWLATLLSAPAKAIISAAGGERKVTLWAVSPEWRDDDDEEEDTAAEEQEALREAVSDLSDKIAREVMTPRTDMSALEDCASLRDAISLISETGVSRIPLYHENIDDIRGIVYSKDLLKFIADTPQWEQSSQSNALTGIARPAFFVPETKSVIDLMVEMRTHTHLVIVTDEYGGTSGLVTLEDLLEEIVGDISDEFDPDEVLIRPLGPDRYVLDARTSVSDLNDLYDTDFDLDADSVGGLFSELVGHIPEVGESVEAEGISLIVTRVEGNRIVELRSYPLTNKNED